MRSLEVNKEQLQQMRSTPGFIAALDQSGGSTPGALRLYGIKEGSWSNDDDMFEIVHQMRSRMITSPAFNGERVIGAILFENTMDRSIEKRQSADYLWNAKRRSSVDEADAPADGAAPES
jgi:fructose-bisphosphate aldolase, class I